MDIAVDTFVLFCERTIDGMRRSVDRLDDITVNHRPNLPAPNSAFQLMTHALAACEWWTAYIVCGHQIDRNRDGEFLASGPVAALSRHADDVVARLRQLIPEMKAATALAHPAPTTSIPLAGDWTVGAALIHAYEELAQHLGHLEITVDLVAAR